MAEGATTAARPYTDEQLTSDDGVSKKDLVKFLQENASIQFLADNKLKGTLKNIAKMKTKDALIADYNKLFESKDFRKEGEDDLSTVLGKVTEKTEKVPLTSQKSKEADVKSKEVPKYTKLVLRKGDGKSIPRKGDTISCFYTGKLQDGTVFDQNVVSERKFKKAQPLRFKVGKNQVIKGWDEALLTMSSGEKAQLVIEPEWAYGKKGHEPKIPPNATLIFEVELVGID